MSEQITNNTKKNKIDVGHFALAFLPFVVLLCIQTAVSMVPMIFAVFKMMQDGTLRSINNPNDMTAAIMGQLGDGFMWSLVVYAIISIITFFFWYKKLNGKNALKIDYKKTFSVKTVIAIVIIAIGLNFATSCFLGIVDHLIPNSMDNYNEMMNTAFGDASVIPLALYGTFLGPIAEEMCLRAATIAHLKKSRCKMWVLLVVQAVCFGIIHLNLVQGLYATVLGLILGIIAIKTGSVVPAIVTHIIYNIFGFFVTGYALEAIGDNFIAFVVVEVVAIVIAVIGYILFRNTKPNYKTAQA